MLRALTSSRCRNRGCIDSRFFVRFSILPSIVAALRGRATVAVTARDRTILWAKAAGRCSHPSCRKQLIKDGSLANEDVLVGEVAHIVAQNASGPRGKQDPPGGTRDCQANLILLCREHHTIIDQQPGRFPVAKLVQWKADHEAWVGSQLSPQDQFTGLATPTDKISERVYSTLLPVQHIPRFVCLAECTSSEAEIQRFLACSPLPPGVVTPFIVRGGKLMTFCDLDDEENPFVQIADPYSAEGTTRRIGGAIQTWTCRIA